MQRNCFFFNSLPVPSHALSRGPSGEKEERLSKLKRLTAGFSKIVQKLFRESVLNSKSYFIL